MSSWGTPDGEELYQIPAWGKGWFHGNDAGHLMVTPPGVEHGIDLHHLVRDLRQRGIPLPVVLRFPELVRARIDELVDAFTTAFEEYGFQGVYRGVYPIKVNQDKHLVDAVVQASRPHHLGLEAGSKPELQIVLATLEDPEALIICNGYKDRGYIQMALLARKLGRNCIIVIEKLDELDRVLAIAEELGIAPAIGLRSKLSAKGSGRWQSSGGDQAKFGLTVGEMVQAVHTLREAGRLDRLQLLHFHIGSQVTAIRAFHKALREAVRLYTELARLGAPMGYLDVGGGLGVDYDGSRTSFESSMNYDVQEYAHTVVSAATEACNAAGIPHPAIVTEAGRALVAYSSVLLFDIIGVNRRLAAGSRPEKPPSDADAAVVELYEVWDAISAKNLQEPLHDANDLRDEALTRFGLGLLTIEDRAAIESLYWHILAKLQRVAGRAEYVPEELDPLDHVLADTYYGNFSVFQSAPDAWAIKQLFPICPIHRLDERPTRKAILADLTCDSDGCIKQFIDRRDVKRVLEVHELGDEPYVLGMFLVGAYQEILGDLHNLFGDTNVVLVTAASNGRGYKLGDVIEGDSIRDVLEYVRYDRRRMMGRIRTRVEQAIEDDRLTPEEGGLLVSSYLQALDSYTYLST